MSMDDVKRRLYEEIWRETFGDSEAFIALYSRTTFDPHRTHLLTSADQSCALSHVQYLPYRMRYKDSSWRAGYISGAATQSDQRGKGLVQHLMRASHQQMWREGSLCAFLIPAEEWLYKWYQRMGYGTLYGKRSTPTLERTPQEIPLAKAWQRYHQWQVTLAELHPTVTHTYHQWRTLLESLSLEGGGVGVLSGEEQYYYYKDEGGHTRTLLTIPSAEAFADNSIDLSTPFAMLRLLRIPQLLSWAVERELLQMDRLAPYALYNDGERIVFDLHDEQIPTNSGRYSIVRKGRKTLFAALPSCHLCKSMTPDQLLEALPSLRQTLVYAMME